jgi:putative ABC transport system ATP-binding protein
MIELRDLRFRWPGAAHDCVAIDSLNVAAGSSLFLHGPSGGGKSTLLGLLAGVLLPREGSVSLMGRPWASLSGAQRDAFRADHVGYIFQQFNLLPYLSVLDNVLLPCRFSALRRQRAARPVRRGRGRALLRRVGLSEALARGPRRCRWASSSVWPRRGH